jgi:hypothetical protein
VSPEFDRQRRAILRVKNLRQPPEEISLLIGEFVYSVRSALDHAAYDLTEWESGTPLSGTIAKSSAFPIFNNGREYRKREKNGKPSRGSGLYKIRGMSRDMRAVVERLQPYHRQKNPSARLLWLLEELANVDKHRLLPLTAAALVGSQFRLSSTSPGPLAVHQIEVFPGPLKPNAILARFAIDGAPGLDMNVEAHAVMDIAFSQDGEIKALRGESVIATLAAIASFVDKSVMPELVKLIPGGEYRMIDSWPPPEPPVVSGAYTALDHL